MSEMTDAEKTECLALAQQMDRVKEFPGGMRFVTDLFMDILAEQELAVIPAVIREPNLRIVVNNYVPPNTIVIHASMEECLRVWRENQAEADQAQRKGRLFDVPRAIARGLGTAC